MKMISLPQRQLSESTAYLIVVFKEFRLTVSQGLSCLI